jgi:tripartite-type tricarboxylate transporter receptor subunit TctC
VKRRFCLAAGAFAGPALRLGTAHGQSFPREKDLRIFVGFEAGGGADAVARAIAVQLQRRTSRRIMVENRTGSFGAVPGDILKTAGPDGSDLALLSSTTLISRLVTKSFPFDPVKDLAPITKVGNYSIAFALSPTLGIESFKDYLDWINQGDATRRRIAVSSNTTFVEVLNVLLRRSIGKSLEPVQYRGVTPILADLRDGRIPATVNTLTSLLPPHHGHRTRIVMTTGPRRLSAAPNIPTALELGYPTLDMEEWFAFFASPSTPAPLVAQLNRRLRSIIEDRELVELLKPLGLEIETTSSDELSALIDSHRKAWQARLVDTGVTGEAVK